MDPLNSLHHVHRGKCLNSLPGDNSPPDPPNWTGTFKPKTTPKGTSKYTGQPTTAPYRPAPPKTVRTTRKPTTRPPSTKKRCPPHRPKC